MKLLSQLFGDRILVANATGCSSIYGGNLPSTPWAVNQEGRGPAWSNSLFEDNAEFGLGMRLTLDKQSEFARELLPQFASQVGEQLVSELLEADQTTEAGHPGSAGARCNSQAAAGRIRSASSPQPAEHGRYTGSQKRVDRRW